MHSSFGRDVLQIDPAAETRRIVESITENVHGVMRRRGAVIAVSGGIDSSVVAALCTRAFGRDRVLALMLPESESSDDTRAMGRLLIESLGIPYIEEDISPVLQGAGCYKRRDDAIRSVVPGFGPGWACKIVLPGLLEADRLRVYSAVVRSPDGVESRTRLSPEAYLGVVASTNFKQRTRKMFEYYHADRMHYAVAGTPNRLEYELGFFVKNGDGAADFKPIAHLYKSQVYQLAAYLELPQEILSRPPTTDTYSLPQSQEEFYFSVPYDQMDLCLWGKNHGVEAADVASALGLRTDQIERVYRDIDSKRVQARYLLAGPMLVDSIGNHPDDA